MWKTILRVWVVSENEFCRGGLKLQRFAFALPLSFWQRCKGEKLLSTGHKTHLAAQLTKSDSSPSSSSSPDSTDSCSSSDSPSSICSHHVPENRRSQSGRVSQNRASLTILLSPTPIRASPQPPACRCTNRAQAPRLHLNVLQSCQGKPMGMVEGGRRKKNSTPE